MTMQPEAHLEAPRVDSQGGVLLLSVLSMIMPRAVPLEGSRAAVHLAAPLGVIPETELM